MILDVDYGLLGEFRVEAGVDETETMACPAKQRRRAA